MDVLKLMQKPFNLRSESEIKTISDYLIKLDTIKEILSTLEEFQSDRLANIATYIKSNTMEGEKIIFKFGERTSNYNLILKGKASLLTPKKEKIFMTEEDYILYLIKLRKYNETDLLEQCLIDNSHEYEIPADFDNWMNQQLQQPHQAHLQNSQNAKNNFRPARSNTISGNSLVDVIRETSKFINEKKVIDDIQSRSDIYISRISPPDNKLANEKKLVVIYRYVVVEVLSAGGKLKEFGEKNLIMNHLNGANLLLASNKNNKSQYTLITEEETTFGWIQNSTYNKIIKDFNEKNKKVLFFAILSYDLFKNISLFNLERKYLQCFKLANFKRGESLANQNDLIKSLFFLKNGEFELTVNLSVIEVVQLIQVLSKYSDTALDEKILYIKDEISNEAHLFKTEEEFKKVFIKKKKIKMGVIKDKEIIGLQDFVYVSNLFDSNWENNHAIFTAKCISEKSEIFKISIEDFRSVMEKENILKENLARYLKNKRKFYLDKLEYYLIEQYETYKHKEKQDQMKIVIEKDYKTDERFNLISNSAHQKILQNSEKNRKLTKINTKIDLEKLTINSNRTEKETAEKFNSTKSTNNFTRRLPKLSPMNEKLALKNREMLNNFSSKDNLEVLHKHTRSTSKTLAYLNNYKMKIIKNNLFDNVMTNYLIDNESSKEDKCAGSNYQREIPMMNKTEENLNVIDCLIMDKFKNVYSSVLNYNSPKQKVTTSDKNYASAKNFKIPLLSKKFELIKSKFVSTKVNNVNPDKL